MKKSLLILVLCLQPVLAQRAANPFLMREAYHIPAADSLMYRYDFGAHALPNAINRSFQLGLEMSVSGQNSAISIYDNYNDGLHYLLSPFLHYNFNNRLTFDVRVNLENIRKKYVYPLRRYWADEFANGRGAFDVAVVRYKNKNFSMRFGRDYFMPGVYFYENLLFSKYQYPYDLIEGTFENRYVKVSSYYLSPTTLQTNGAVYQRHINGHRISVRLPWGYLAFNDLMLYGGVNKSMDIMAANPFIFLYPYRKNKKHLDGNNLMSLEIYLKQRDFYLYLETLLDDWQADHQVPTDLEPTEWGMNLTLGVNNVIQGLDYKINYTRVANRTYNVETNPYEKYLNRNYPIGHWLGNNFWEAKTSFIYRPGPDWVTDLTISYLQYGDEAVYGVFNTDYENYTIEQGYTEMFPFGKVKSQAGFTVNGFYTVSPDFILRGRLGYWFKNSRLKNDFNIGLSLAYRLNIMALRIKQ